MSTLGEREIARPELEVRLWTHKRHAVALDAYHHAAMLPHVRVFQNLAVEVTALLELEGVEHEIVGLVSGRMLLLGLHVFDEMPDLVACADGQHLIVGVEIFLG